MHDFSRKYATISLEISKIRDFSRLVVLKCAFFFLPLFCFNTLLFRWISAKFVIFATNCLIWTFPLLIFLKSTIILCRYTIILSKISKIHDILRLSFNFSDRTEFSKFGNHSPLISCKKLSCTLKNCQHCTKLNFFGNNEFHSKKGKNSAKPENFLGRDCPCYPFWWDF